MTRAVRFILAGLFACTGGQAATTTSAGLDEIRIDESCTCCGDPNEDVDLQDPGRRYAPRPVLAADLYTTTIRAKNNELGGARIRSRLVFAAADQRNVLGTLPSGVTVRAAGPMKNSTFSDGIGYSIRLVDSHGQSCQGFVSATVVTVL